MTQRPSLRFKLVLLTVSAAVALVAAQPASAALSGPDVSSWQHPNGAAIDWNQVRGAGNTFAFVKATEGPSGYYQNPYFASDWAKTRAAGLIRGAYHFARPEFSAVDQANYFISVVGSGTAPGDLPPALDLEQTGGLAPADLANWTQAFLSRVQALTGRTPMVYSYPYFIRNSLGNTAQFAHYPLWLADWTGGSGPNYPLPGGWGAFTFWQFTSSATVPGISGNVDMSNYCCDQRNIDALSGRDSCDITGGNALTAVHPSIQAAVVGINCALYVRQSPSGSFTSLGGMLLGAPAVVPSGPTSDPFYVATGGNGDLYVRSGTTGWQALTAGGSVACIDNPAAVIVGGNFWVACQGWAHDLLVAQSPVPASGLPQISSSSWHSVGGILATGPGAAAIGGNPGFFVIGLDHHVFLYTPVAGYSMHQELCNGHPAAATYGSATYFACQGLDRSLWYKTFNGISWSGASSLGGLFIDGPGVAAGPTGPTFFGEGLNTAVYERSLSSGWVSDGGLIRYGVGAAWIP